MQGKEEEKRMRKLFSFFILLLVLVIPTYATISTYPDDTNWYNAVYHWKFNDCEGVGCNKAIDSLRSLNFTLTGSYRFANEGNFPEGTYFLRDNNTAYNTPDTQQGITNSESNLNSGIVSLSFWFYTNYSASRIEEFLLGKYDAGASKKAFMVSIGSSVAGRFFTYTDDGSNNCQQEFDYTFSKNAWYHIVMILDPLGDNCSLYVNGSLTESNDCDDYSSNCGAIYNVDEEIYVLNAQGQTKNWNGGIDEFLIFNDSLKQDEITNLYTGNYPATPRIISWVSPTPADDYHMDYYEESMPILNATCTTVPANFTLWVGTTNPPAFYSSETMVNYSSWSYIGGVVPDITYYYIANCGGANSSVRSFTIDSTDPTMTINSAFFGVNNVSNVSQYDGNNLLNVNINAYDLNLYGFEFNITYCSNSTSVYGYRNTSLYALSIDSFNYTANINYSLWDRDNNMCIDIWTSDSHTLNELPNWDIKPIVRGVDFTSETGVKVKIYTSEDSNISTTKNRDRYNFKVKYKDSLIKDRTIFVDCEGATYLKDSKYKGHIICGDGVRSGSWVDTEGFPGKPIVTIVSENLISLTFKNAPSELDFKSVGGLNIIHSTYLWYLPDLPIQYNTSITSLNGYTPIVSNEKMMGYINDTCPSGNCTLIFNWYLKGVLNATETKTLTGTKIYGYFSNVTSANLTYGQNWTFSQGLYDNIYGNSTSTIWSNSSQIIVSKYYLDNCSNVLGLYLPSNATAYVISWIDLNKNYINVNVTTLLSYLSTTYATPSNLMNTTSLCVYPSWGEVYGNISLFYQYGTIFYNYLTLDSLFDSVTNYINLTIESGTTDVTATVYNEIGTFLEGAYIQPQRYDPITGNYVSVGSFATNFEGQVKVPLTLNTVYYKFLIYYPYGTLRETTNPTYIYSTSISFYIDTTEDALEDYYTTENMVSELTFNNVTNNFKYVYADSSSRVETACLKIYLHNFGGNSTYSENCMSGSTGTLLSNVANTSGATYIAKAFVYIDGNEIPMDTLSYHFASTEAKETIGYLGLLVLLLVTIPFAFLFYFSIPLAVIMIPLPTVMLSTIGFIAIDPAIAWGMEFVAIIIAIMINKRS